MMFIYSCALLLVLVLGLPYWLLRMATSGKYRTGLSGRLGRVPQRLRQAVQGKPTIWLHAVSVGEVLAASRVVQELAEARPGYAIVISTTTRTGQQLACERFGADRVFYFPLDLPWIVQRYLRALQPGLLILVESEFWPGLLAACANKGVPVAVINARVSDRSLPRYLRLRALWRRILRNVTLFMAQSEEDGRRLAAIGAPADRILNTGNLKYDVRPATCSELTRQLQTQLPADAKLLVCGSTLEGEDTALLDCWPALLEACPTLVMVLAPRHPERFDAVARLVEARLQSEEHQTWLRRSQWQQQPLAPGTILLLDSIGELASLYSLATVAFIGGSLFGAGGHNPLEPAQFGVPVVMGNSFENFRDVTGKLQAANAICIVRPGQLCAVLQGMLLREAEAKTMGQRSREVFNAQSGATARTVADLLSILRPHEGQRP